MLTDFLADTGRAGLYSLLPAEQRSALLEAAAGSDLFHQQIDLAACRTSSAVLGELGRALAFPDWYGRNFDALHDCLTDPDWQPAAGHVIFIDGLAALRNGDPEGFATLIEVLQSAADVLRKDGKPFWLLLDIAARGVPALPSA